MSPHTTLLEQIEQSFTLDELKTLCYRLKIDYDNLDGEGKAGKVREFVMHIERRSLLNYLIHELTKIRPDKIWSVYHENKNTPASPWIDTTYNYTNQSWNSGSKFRLRISRLNATTVVMVSQLLETGLSLMNVVEQIATQIAQTFDIPETAMVFIEHYPPGYLSDGRETYEIVQFNWSAENKRFTDPRWQPISKQQAESLIMHSL